jgi:hypothetical protein
MFLMSLMSVGSLMSGIVRKKPVGSLMPLRQGPEESLKSFLIRFNQERLATEDAIEEFVYCALFLGIKRDGPLMADLARKPPRSVYEFMERVEEFINQEEILRAFLGFNLTRASSSETKKRDNPQEELGDTECPLEFRIVVGSPVGL